MNKEMFLQLAAQSQENGIVVEGETFENFSLNGLKLERCHFVNCVWDGVEFNNCRFGKTNFQKNTFMRCNMEGVDFQNCKLNGCRWVNSNGRLTTFDNCEMEEAKIDKGNWIVCYWMMSDMSAVEMNDVSMQRSILQGSELKAAQIYGGTFEDVRFLRSTVRNAKFVDAQLLDTSLDEVAGQQLPNTEFNHCFFANSIFASMDLDGVAFLRCRFRNGQFAGSSLHSAQFRESEVGNANFRSCRFGQTDFRGVDITECIFDEDLNTQQLILDSEGPSGLSENTLPGDIIS